MTTPKQTTSVGVFLAFTLLLTGCAAESKTENAEAPNSTAPSNPPTETTKPKDEPVTQEATCDWETGRLESGASNAPSSNVGELSTVLIGAWQHTHIDSGAGFEPVKPTTDIRYVFPSTTTLVYCQDVTGAMKKAGRTVTISLDGVELILPSPATGYAVTAWDANTMAWENHRDGSLYFLKRR